MRIFLRENFQIDINDSIKFVLIYELKWSYIFIENGTKLLLKNKKV